MTKGKKLRTCGWLLILVTAVVAAPLCLNLMMSSAQEQAQDSEDGLPTADFDAPLPDDKIKREKRIKKGRKYDKEDPPVKPDSDLITSTASSHWFYGLTPLPVAQSSVVIVGEVTDAKAYLSPEKTGVYSEFSVRAEEVLKTDDATIVPDSTVDVERYGGKVRLPSGRVQTYTVLNQGAPRVRRKYAFFLKRTGGDLQILTGYELRQNKVHPLDSVPLFEMYKNASTQNFMKILRHTIATPSLVPGAEYALPADNNPDPDPYPDSGDCAAPAPGPCVNTGTIPGASRFKPNQAYTVTI